MVLGPEKGSNLYKGTAHYSWLRPWRSLNHLFAGTGSPDTELTQPSFLGHQDSLVCSTTGHPQVSSAYPESSAISSSGTYETFYTISSFNHY